MQILQIQTRTNGENKASPYRENVYETFILWSALPPVERPRLGFRTQGEFCEAHQISINTPTRWKERPDFTARVEAIRHEWGFEKTSDVMEAVCNAAIKGNANSQKLWLQYFCGFNEKSKPQKTKSPVITVDDIRFLIEALPEPHKTKHRANLKELLDDASAVQNARDQDDQIWTTAQPISELQEDVL